MLKKNYAKPFMSLERFAAQNYCEICDPSTMYTISPVTYTAAYSHDKIYMLGENCSGEFQGPVVPNHQEITISKDAYPTIMSLLNNSQKWELAEHHQGNYINGTGFVYYSIATSSNSYGGHINMSNVSTFHATQCGDNASENALIILNAESGITANRS